LPVLRRVNRVTLADQAGGRYPGVAAMDLRRGR
jgi:hypothetical protein